MLQCAFSVVSRNSEEGLVPVADDTLALELLLQFLFVVLVEVVVRSHSARHLFVRVYKITALRKLISLAVAQQLLHFIALDLDGTNGIYLDKLGGVCLQLLGEFAHRDIIRSVVYLFDLALTHAFPFVFQSQQLILRVNILTLDFRFASLNLIFELLRIVNFSNRFHTKQIILLRKNSSLSRLF